MQGSDEADLSILLLVLKLGASVHPKCWYPSTRRHSRKLYPARSLHTQTYSSFCLTVKKYEDSFNCKQRLRCEIHGYCSSAADYLGVVRYGFVTGNIAPSILQGPVNLQNVENYLPSDTVSHPIKGFFFIYSNL